MSSRSVKNAWASSSSTSSFHPFVYGNKRVAFFATDVFLRLNGWKLDVDDEEAHVFLTERLESGTCSFDALLPWIRRHLARHDSP